MHCCLIIMNTKTTRTRFAYVANPHEFISNPAAKIHVCAVPYTTTSVQELSHYPINMFLFTNPVSASSPPRYKVYFDELLIAFTFLPILSRNLIRWISPLASPSRLKAHLEQISCFCFPFYICEQLCICIYTV